MTDSPDKIEGTMDEHGLGEAYGLFLHPISYVGGLMCLDVCMGIHES